MLKLKPWETVTFGEGEDAITFDVKRLNFLEERVFSTKMNRVRRDKVVKFALIAQTEAQERQRVLLARLNAALVSAGLEAMPEGEDLDAAFRAAEARATEHKVTVPPMSGNELAALLNQDEDRIADQQAALEEFFASVEPAWLVEVFRDYVRNVSGLEYDGEPVTTGEGLLQVADQNLVLFVLNTIAGFANLSATAKKALSSLPISGPGEATDGGTSPAPSAASEDGTALGTVPETLAEQPSSFVPVVVPIRNHA